VARVVGFGALNMDRILFVNKIPGPDDEGFINSIESSPGGSAPNTAVGLSRLGVDSGCIGGVGKDLEGSTIIGALEGEGVRTEGIRIKDGRSGSALVMVDTNGIRSILIDPGVNDSMGIDEIDLADLESSDLVHMTSFICRNTDLSFKTQNQIAKSMDTPISLDPGQLYAERGFADMSTLIGRCRYFLPNEGELRLLTGKSPEGGARKVIDTGAEVVVVKRGMKGSYATDGSREVTIPIYGERGLDTTGAGDAFNTGFLYGALSGHDLGQSCELGAKVAWFSVQKPGARDGLPTLEELLARA
jgi:ribokinase